MDKSTAIKLFKENGFNISGKVTFCSENNSAGKKYWGNPNVNCLDSEWWIILNDIDNNKLNLFYVPAKTLKKEELVLRADDPKYIDLQIFYEDSHFTDSKSKIRFETWYKTTIVYDAAGAKAGIKNSKIISMWKGGNGDDVLIFDPPYDYEKCLLGVTTDGHAVYDFYKAADFYVKKASGRSRVPEEEDYNLRYEWQEMVDHDYRFFEKDGDKSPFFLQDYAGDGEIEDPKYDFSNCIIGHAFHYENTIYSLQKMMEVIMKQDNCSKAEAKQICYNYGKAGSLIEGTTDFYNYAILDECLDDIPVTFKKA